MQKLPKFVALSLIAHFVVVSSVSFELPRRDVDPVPLQARLQPTEPPAAAPVAMAVPTGNAARVAGVYRDFHHTRQEMSRAISLVLQARVDAEPDGSIRWRERRWVEVASLAFKSADGRETIVFRADGSGRIASLHAWGGHYERLRSGQPLL